MGSLVFALGAMAVPAAARGTGQPPSPFTHPRTLVILPTYDERDTIGEVLEGSSDDRRLDALVVDDGSPDGTGAIVRAVATDPRIRLVERPGKAGLASAYGWGSAGGSRRATTSSSRWTPTSPTAPRAPAAPRARRPITTW